MIKSRFSKGILCSLALTTIGSQSQAALITVAYSGYGHNGNSSAPAAASPFNTGNIDTSGLSSSVHSANVASSDALATGTRDFATSYSGDGTSSFSATSNIASFASINDPTYSAGKQFDGGYYRYIGFSVDETGNYSIAGDLKSRAVTNVPGGAGNYTYYGLGGNVNLAINNFPAANTPVYSTPATGNIGDPAPNTTVFSFATTQMLTAGVQYQLTFDSYMYQGFGGTGTVTHNSGWDVSIAAIPEPSSLALSAAFIGLVGLRSRRRTNV
jgi:hypothetical protein